MSNNQMRMQIGIDAKTFDAYWCSWFSGFTDGEGCFMIILRKNGTAPNICFRIQLRADDKSILKEIHHTLGIGRTKDHKRKIIRPNWNPAYIFEINKINDIVNVLIPIFDAYPLRAKKLRDYKIWREAAFIVYSKGHLNDKLSRLIELRNQLHATKQFQ